MDLTWFLALVLMLPSSMEHLLGSPSWGLLLVMDLFVVSFSMLADPTAGAATSMSAWVFLSPWWKGQCSIVGMFARNRTTLCWGDETGSSVISLTPKNLRFQYISAGGFHVCGILENSQVFCWGRSLATQQSSSDVLGQGDVNMVPMDPMISVAGGRFHACGIKRMDHRVVCWGFKLQNSVPPPRDSRVYEIVAGDYFTCGVLAEPSLRPLC
ncbi:hypothetical protein ZIOFF_036976 [Zingiber officinale]|uniref:non-specific serine/threonine protein kinase n=1 Tax=Zingiber officinale TaxID=94328 RepID=A0A8J5L8Y3_ZINOF|nr:hypothetical protein ZIOFF_036976 [Zingiber officinale]